MSPRILMCAALCSALLAGDTLVLRSGRSVEGTYLGGDSRKVRMAVGDSVESFSVDEISDIRFGSGGKPAAAATSTPAPATRRRAEVLRPAPATPVEHSGRREVPAGTTLVVRMIDDVDSERDSLGQTFRASVDEAVVVNGETVIPRGADVVAKLVADKEAGRLTGRSELTLDLQTVTVNGRQLEIATGEVTQQGESRTRQTATRTGGGAALGAIIGAIAGGGRGAAIGAATGAAAGGAVQVLTKGEKVRIPSETRLSFTLQNPLAL
jgi:hypothetical protein